MSFMYKIYRQLVLLYSVNFCKRPHSPCSSTHILLVPPLTFSLFLHSHSPCSSTHILLVLPLTFSLFLHSHSPCSSTHILLVPPLNLLVQSSSISVSIAKIFHYLLSSFKIGKPYKTKMFHCHSLAV